MFSKNAVTVLERRYLKKDKDGKPTEKPDDLLARVAHAIAEADQEFDLKADIKATQDTFYKMMADLRFMPNSPTLMNAGRELGQLSACFVLPVADSMEDIFDAVKNAALIHKSGGGTGFSFTRLRGTGSSVNSTGGVASGPVSFMKVFNAATEAVKQGGTRRGANMGILRIDHPDILEFIQCKKNTSEITNFNISVGITEEFMQAVSEKREYSLIDPHTKEEVKRLYAPDVYAMIVKMAWTNGEPGIVFLDRINRDNPVPKLGEVESTNPCGEQPLLPYESCNLGSINLNALMVKNGGEYALDYDLFKQTIRDAVHFLDTVITVNNYPLDEIRDMTLSTRKIGLGLMGFADILYKLKIPYNSEKAIELAEHIMQFLRDNAREMSSELAKQRGTFPAYDESVFQGQGLVQRNATVTTIAPTGTISIICNSSSGIEPVFGLSYIRNVMDNDELLEVHPYFEEVMKERGLYSKELMSRIASEGTIAHIEEIPEDIRNVFVTAHDINPESHVRMQAAFQKYTDNAVSKTVNFPREATQEDVRKVYDLAYKLGLKGVTIYRDGSRDAQVLNIGKVNKKEDGTQIAVEDTESAGIAVAPRDRPEVTQGITQKVKIGCGNLYITVNYDENGICEVFTNLGRAGGCPSQSEATSRLISTALRSGMDVDSIVEQLRGIRCHSTLRKGGDVKVLSCPDAIGRVLQTVAQMQDVKIAPLMQEDAEQQPDDTKCPECGKTLEFEGGCNICRSCGYSKCG
ncbi:MAG: vitamin B12-dependent ribonucleotide reductase [Christensenella sp.]|uniref:vitamin B12-dependent ribonucleotide reductase n=1 Tax=Christensenella sp. TaxID=1935934 RepID=UPI002B208A2D|nr:vitamin B12-dependent ribonucleotide reductase [Christensenella sp.]MEA5004392.1 vitamin B12-dependent ribonucleotide reductase [Christensenella sp.]